MTVLEITYLSLSLDSNRTAHSLLPALQTVRTALAEKVHPTHSRFYVAVSPENQPEARQEICILGSWPSVATHRSFLADDELREEVLAPQEGVLQFVEGTHARLGNDADKNGGMNSEILPLDAPVIVFERFKTPIEKTKFVEKDKESLRDATMPYPVFGQWICACDCVGHCSCESRDTGGTWRELARLSGWRSLEAYDEWKGRQFGNEVKGTAGGVEEREVKLFFDLEGNK